MTSLLKKTHIKTSLKGTTANWGKKGMNKTMFCKEGVAQEKKLFKKQICKCISNLFLIPSPLQFQANKYMQVKKLCRFSKPQIRYQSACLCK